MFPTLSPRVRAEVGRGPVGWAERLVSIEELRAARAGIDAAAPLPPRPLPLFGPSGRAVRAALPAGPRPPASAERVALARLAAAIAERGEPHFVSFRAALLRVGEELDVVRARAR